MFLCLTWDEFIYLFIFGVAQDKWRNMSCSANGQGPREKSRNSKAKANTDVPAAQPSAAQTATTVPAVRDAAAAPNLDDSSKGASDGKNFSMYERLLVLASLFCF